jgi:hypothetical protein
MTFSEVSGTSRSGIHDRSCWSLQPYDKQTKKNNKEKKKRRLRAFHRDLIKVSYVNATESVELPNLCIEQTFNQHCQFVLVNNYLPVTVYLKMELRDYLEEMKDTPDFLLELSKFFAENQQTLHQLTITSSKGAVFYKIVRDTLQELSSQLKDPLRAVNSVVELNLPTSKYQTFSKLNKWYVEIYKLRY